MRDDFDAEGEAGAVLQFLLPIFESAGTDEIETIDAGEDFILKVFVSDVRMTTRDGVFSAGLDISYDPALTSVIVDKHA